MDHNGTFFSPVVEPFFQSIEYKGVTVFSVIGVFCYIKSEGALIRSRFIREGSGIIGAAVSAVALRLAEDTTGSDGGTVLTTVTVLRVGLGTGLSTG